jgi:hypothetical protein
MSAILRWFEYDGRRYRAWFRQNDDGHRELVLAGPGWQAQVPGAAPASLDELSDDRLNDLVSNLRQDHRQQ